MSRIGNKHIEIPAGVAYEIKPGVMHVKGPKGEEDVIINSGIEVKVDGNIMSFVRLNEEKQTKQNHGTTRANVANAIVGVTKGYAKVIEMVGIGYKAALKGKAVELWAGYSHTVVIEPEPGVAIKIIDPTHIEVSGVNKQAVGQTAALIRGVRPPEPYLGKGIRYKGEFVATKEGKRATAKA
jgi:large subunit ribosomal protein L6